MRITARAQYLLQRWDLYILLLPGIALTIVFKYVPMYGVLIAFQEYEIFDGFANSRFVGIEHFRKLLSDRYFYTVFLNSLSISLLKLIWIFPLPIILAILLNEVKNKYFARSVQTVIYLPHFLSWPIVYGIFYALLSRDGPLNDLLVLVGLDRVTFFISPRFFRSVLVASDAWKGVGWSSIIYLAALTAIDKELYEAADIDGAGRFRKMRYITLPGILSTIMIMLVLRLGSLLSAGFEQIIIMYNPTVYDVADVIETYVYRTGLGQQNYSYAAAVGLFNSVISFILVVSSNMMARKNFGRSIW
jgi:putative aldouronate transport system permease protein